MTAVWKAHKHLPLLYCVDPINPKVWLATMAKNMNGTIYPRIRDPQAKVPHMPTETALTNIQRLINTPS